MALFVAGPLLGTAFGQVFTSLRETVKDAVNKVHQFKPILERLKSTLDRLSPVVDRIVELSEKLDLPESETERLKKHMEEGVKLVRNCLTVQRWNYVSKFKYSSKLKDLDNEIVRFCWLDLIAQCTRNGLMTLEICQKMINILEILRKEIPRPVETPNGLEITRIMSDISQRMDSICSMETPKVSFAVHEPPDFTVGFDMPMKELKMLLLKEEVTLLLLTAPGGCGKTTLVQMLCQDEIIKGTSLSFVCQCVILLSIWLVF